MTKQELKQVKSALKEGDLKIIEANVKKHSKVKIHYQTVRNVFKDKSKDLTVHAVLKESRIALVNNIKESEKAIKLIDKYV